MTDVPVAYTVAADLLEAARAALEAIGVTPARVMVGRGRSDLDQECCKGALVAWFERQYPTDPFPQPAQLTKPADCATVWGGDFHVGWLRCVTAFGDSSGKAPKPDVVDAEALSLLAEAEAVRVAVSALLRQWGKAMKAAEYHQSVMRGQDVIEAEGGCAGYDLTLTVSLGTTPC